MTNYLSVLTKQPNLIKNVQEFQQLIWYSALIPNMSRGGMAGATSPLDLGPVTRLGPGFKVTVGLIGFGQIF